MTGPKAAVPFAETIASGRNRRDLSSRGALCGNIAIYHGFSRGDNLHGHRGSPRRDWPHTGNRVSSGPAKYHTCWICLFER
jgi:hypothetical protein